MSERFRLQKQTSMEFVTFAILFMASLAWEVNCRNQENFTEIIQFPFDPETSDTFASIPITPAEEPFESFTLCLSFRGGCT